MVLDALKNSGIRLYLCITKIIPPYNLFLINQILNLRLNPQDIRSIRLRQFLVISQLGITKSQVTSHNIYIFQGISELLLLLMSWNVLPG